MIMRVFEALRWLWTREVRLLPGVYPLSPGDVLLLAKASEGDEQLAYRVCQRAVVVERLLTGEVIGVILAEDEVGKG